MILSVHCTCWDGKTFPRFVPIVLAVLEFLAVLRDETFQYPIQSSENNLVLESMQLGKSLMKSRKSSCPSTIPLWYSTYNWYFIWRYSMYYHFLLPGWEGWLDPVVCCSSDSAAVSFFKNALMRNKIKSLWEIKDNQISFLVLVDVPVFGKFMVKSHQLCLATSTCSEAMLSVCQDDVVLQVIHHVADKDVFLKFATQAC